jgi:hypothetical protein
MQPDCLTCMGRLLGILGAGFLAKTGLNVDPLIPTPEAL